MPLFPITLYHCFMQYYNGILMRGLQPSDNRLRIQDNRSYVPDKRSRYRITGTLRQASDCRHHVPGTGRQITCGKRQAADTISRCHTSCGRCDVPGIERQASYARHHAQVSCGLIYTGSCMPFILTRQTGRSSTVSTSPIDGSSSLYPLSMDMMTMSLFSLKWASSAW